MVRAKTPKRVYLLGNLPVDIPVDHLIGWDEIMPSRLDHVFEEDGGIALSPTGLHLTRPDAFDTQKAAEGARAREKDRPLAPFEAIEQRLLRVIVRFRRIVNGKPSVTAQVPWRGSGSSQPGGEGLGVLHEGLDDVPALFFSG